MSEPSVLSVLSDLSVPYVQVVLFVLSVLMTMMTKTTMMIITMTSITITRSYAALWAADLDWIVRPGYSSVGYILGENRKKQLTFEMGEGGKEGINKNVTHAESQLTF